MYDYHTLQSHTPPAPQQLGDLQVDGWEFITVIFWPEQKTFYTYLRKPVTVQ